MREVAKVEPAKIRKQSNVWVDEDVWERIQALWNRGIDVAEEKRKALTKMVEELERV